MLEITFAAIMGIVAITFALIAHIDRKRYCRQIRDLALDNLKLLVEIDNLENKTDRQKTIIRNLLNQRSRQWKQADSSKSAIVGIS
jgi:hypothetical protein